MSKEYFKYKRPNGRKPLVLCCGLCDLMGCHKKLLLGLYLFLCAEHFCIINL